MRQILWSQDPEDAALRLTLRDKYDLMSRNHRIRLRPQARAFILEERSTRDPPPPPYEVAELQLPLVHGFSATFLVVAMQQYLRAVVRNGVVSIRLGFVDRGHPITK